MFKPLLKDIPFLCDLPMNFRADILKLMANFQDFNKGEEIIPYVQKFPDIYILFKGKIKFSKYSLAEIELEKEEK